MLERGRVVAMTLFGPQTKTFARRGSHVCDAARRDPWRRAYTLAKLELNPKLGRSGD